VLITSNAHASRGCRAPVEIRLWPKEIGAGYLIVRCGVQLHVLCVPRDGLDRRSSAQTQQVAVFALTKD
jgi:hypothetical protein